MSTTPTPATEQTANPSTQMVGGRCVSPCSAWRPIGELGEIAYMSDGSVRWNLNAGYEDFRLFLVYLSTGEIETHYASIGDDGTLWDTNGDDCGWSWCDAEYFMDIPARPSLPNTGAQATTPAPTQTTKET